MACSCGRCQECDWARSHPDEDPASRPTWSRFFQEWDITRGGRSLNDEEIEKIRESVPELSAAPAVKITAAWEAFSDEEYSASCLIVHSQQLEEFRAWLDF